jgi:hypothetical protein
MPFTAPVRETDLRNRLLPDGLPFLQASIGEEAGNLSGSVEERDATIMKFQPRIVALAK